METPTPAPAKKRKRGGRPGWKVTKPILEKIKKLASSGMAMVWVVKGLGISMDTYLKYRNKDPRLTAAFDEGRALMVERIAEALPDILAGELARAKAGDKDALARIFQKVMDEDTRHVRVEDEGDGGAASNGARPLVQIFIPDNGRPRPKIIEASPATAALPPRQTN